jgi:hypothetical protein
MLTLGIEHEFVFADESGRYLDADNTDYSVFSDIVDEFPRFEGDDAFLDCKSLERYPKRCYVEGFERHDHNGSPIETLPKGLELRTLPHGSVAAVIEDFSSSYAEVMRLARRHGLSPVLTSRHPFKTSLSFEKQIGAEERSVRTDAELALARRAMFSHGLHITVSIPGLPNHELMSLAEKVRFYTPALIPWSFSSPFYQGTAFAGLCSRNYLRAESRALTEVHFRRDTGLLQFRGFDSCGDVDLLEALLQLFTGFLLDQSLPGKALKQDPEQVKRSSVAGFGDPLLREEAWKVLAAARAALDGGADSLGLLETMLISNDSYAARMRHRYSECGSIMESISGQYAH